MEMDVSGSSPPSNAKIPQNTTKKSNYLWVLYLFIFGMGWVLFSKWTESRQQGVITILWEDRFHFAFYLIVLFYFLVLAIAYISIKYTANKKDPIQNPFMTAYFNSSNYQNFVIKMKMEISTIRSEHDLEGFQSSSLELKPKNTSEENQKSRSDVNGKSWIIDTILSSIDSIRIFCRDMIMKTYLSKNNTITTIIN
jgi:hypothetical protein